jgi:hypothetical protein
MIMNWSKHTMSFWYNKRWVTFQGLNGNLETLNNVLRSTRRKEVGWLNTCENANSIHSEGQQGELNRMLSKYDGVFKEPTRLPPKRQKEHVINLKEGHDAVNVRPYRYPHHHKNEIEK